ncbi:MAG: hypothetical protein QOH88_1813 [Verrucomicrobiota bacterium]|jgi:hypothetical protein
MKPTSQFNPKSRRDQGDRAFRSGSSLPLTDYNFQTPAVASKGGRRFGSRGPSIRSISQDYFNNEVRGSFVREAVLFSLIVMTVAVPLINSGRELLHLVRSFGL